MPFFRVMLLNILADGWAGESCDGPPRPRSSCWLYVTLASSLWGEPFALRLLGVQMPEAATTIRLTEEDRANVQRIIGTGAAANTSEAIRVALAEYARRAPRLSAIERRLAEAEVIRRTSPREIELLPGGGLINVVLGDASAGRQRVLARVLSGSGQVVVGAALEWNIEPNNLARIAREGDSLFVEGLREGRGVLTVRSGELSAHAFLDVWRQMASVNGTGRAIGRGTVIRTR